MRLSILAAALALVATGAMAQHAHRTGVPKQTGQAQFAALAQIVATLRDDPETDWANVDIDALRAHLLDMDNVTLKAKAVQAVTETGVTFTVTGDAAVASSITRMVLAHTPMLQQATGWSAQAQARPDGATLILNDLSQEDMAQIVGLGFFGLLTIGAHHQQHHMMIAAGRSPH